MPNVASGYAGSTAGGNEVLDYPVTLSLLNETIKHAAEKVTIANGEVMRFDGGMANKETSSDIELPIFKIDGRALDFLPITPLELAHLTAELASAKMIGQFEPSGGIEDQRRMIAEAHDFLCLCADVLLIRKQAIERKHKESRAMAEFEKLIKPYGDTTPIPMIEILKFLRIDRIKLRADELSAVGIKKQWEVLSNDERAAAIYLYLTREPVLREAGRKLPLLDGRVLTLGGGGSHFGSDEERHKTALHGMSAGTVMIIGQALVEAKERRDQRLKSEAGKSSRKKPQRRSPQGTFAKTKRKKTGTFAQQGTD